MRKYTPYLIVFSLSFCIFSLQVLLAILFEVFVFSPFFSISLAFLGLSAAGSFCYFSYFKKDAPASLKHVSFYYCGAGILLFSYPFVLRFSSIASLQHAQPLASIPLQQILLAIFNNSLLIGALFILLFFCLGVASCLMYKYFSDKASTLYFFDLLGGSCGCIFSTVIFNFFQLSSAFLILAFFIFLCTAVLNVRQSEPRVAKVLSFIFALTTVFCLIHNVRSGYLEQTLDPHFLLSDWNMRQDAQEIWHRWNVYSRISLIKHKLPTEQNYSYDFVINNGEGLARLESPKEDARGDDGFFKAFAPSSLAFLYTTPKDILILFAGAGKDMVDSDVYSKGASSIVGVEINPLIVNKAFSMPGFGLQEFFRRNTITMSVEEGRAYLERTPKVFDAIILSNSVAGAKNYLGIPDYTGKFLYTKEAFVSYFRHLKPQGSIGITSCNKINVIAMAKEAFDQLGYKDFFNKIIVFTASDQPLEGELEQDFFKNNTTRVLIKNSDFSREEVAAIEKNIATMNHVLIYTPFYSNIQYPFFRQLIQAKDTRLALKELRTTYRRNFFIPTDDRPFVDQLATFGDIIRYKLLSREGSIAGTAFKGGILFYALIVKFNVFLFLCGAFLIFSPLVIKRQAVNFRILLYFAILGLGFIFAEIGIMQYCTLLLGSPVYSFSVILALFILSSGIGSLLSRYFFARGLLNIKKLSVLLFLVLCLYYLCLPQWIHFFLRFSTSLKIASAACFIFPLGICLGMPYPQGLSRVYGYNKDMVPLALATNGFMGIVASALSPFLSWGIGFSAFLLIAGMLYLLIIFINVRFHEFC